MKVIAKFLCTTCKEEWEEELKDDRYCPVCLNGYIVLREPLPVSAITRVFNWLRGK